MARLIRMIDPHTEDLENIQYSALVEKTLLRQRLMAVKAGRDRIQPIHGRP